jgi:hypothetical protein
MKFYEKRMKPGAGKRAFPGKEKILKILIKSIHKKKTL